MKVPKWVDFGQEIEIDITMEDVRQALVESFETATEDPLGEPPRNGEMLRALNIIATFLRAITDDQIRRLQPNQIELVQKFFFEAAVRFSEIGKSLAAK